MRAYGVPVVDEHEVGDPDAAVAAAEALGFPVVVKLCGDGIAHKTERGLVRLRVGRRGGGAVGRRRSCWPRPDRTTARSRCSWPAWCSGQPRADRRAGARPEQFGMNVMVGVGGILAEAIGDVVVLPGPGRSRSDAEDMIDALAAQALLGPLRGEPAVDRTRLADVLARPVARWPRSRPDVVAVDVNPLHRRRRRPSPSTRSSRWI